MSKFIPVAAVMLVACSAIAHAQAVAGAAQVAAPPQEQSASAVPASDGLSDLNALTFGCAKASLNAAAREAAKVPSQGTYQFSYFKIINDAHHASYEVHFKSNYQDEAELQYCVTIYCQQGWDPKTTKTSVTLMSTARRPMTSAAHASTCGAKPPAAKRPAKR